MTCVTLVYCTLVGNNIEEYSHVQILAIVPYIWLIVLCGLSEINDQLKGSLSATL